MSYLAKLRALESEKITTPSPTEPTKAPSVGFVGDPRATFRNIEGSEVSRRQLDTPLTVQDLPSRQEQRRDRLLAILDDHPGLRYAVLGDDSDPEHPGRVVLALAL